MLVQGFLEGMTLSVYPTSNRLGPVSWSYMITQPDGLPLYSKSRYSSKAKAVKAAKLAIGRLEKDLRAKDVWANHLGGVI